MFPSPDMREGAIAEFTFAKTYVKNLMKRGILEAPEHS